jgi:hypothetical protein
MLITFTSFVKGFPQRYRFPEQCFEFRTFLPTDINVVVSAQEAGLEFTVRSNPEAVAESAELGIMERADNFNLSPVKKVFFPVVHPPGDDLF